MLREFCIIREGLDQAEFDRKSRQLFGRMLVTQENVDILAELQNHGHIETCIKDGKSCSDVHDALGNNIEITLNPRSLPYYEDIGDLAAYTNDEPPTYFVHGIGAIISENTGGQAGNLFIDSYRQLIHARKLLRNTAEYETPGKAIFLTPEKLEILLNYSDTEIPNLPHLKELENQFEKRPDRDPADVDQRLVLFHKSLREFLKAHPPQERFKLFLRNFETIFESYQRDYQLWIGNTFGELEKAFEEKRLKFVSDLNGILAGVQASILAVPITAILLADKYDLGNPLKDFLLAVGILAVGFIAFRILQNQEATLDATRHAINATKTDFEAKCTRRKEEFQTRLKNLDAQEKRVRVLLKLIRNAIVIIIIVSFIGWLFAATK